MSIVTYRDSANDIQVIECESLAHFAYILRHEVKPDAMVTLETEVDGFLCLMSLTMHRVSTIQTA